MRALHSPAAGRVVEVLTHGGKPGQIDPYPKTSEVIIMRRFTVATLVMAVALFTACDGDSTGNGGSIVGTYNLQTFNGMSLPVAATRLGGGHIGPPISAPFGGDAVIGFELTAGSVPLNSDDTCSLSLTFRTTIREATGNVIMGTDTETDTCTYSVTGTNIQLIVDPEGLADLVTGTISGNTLTIVGSYFGVLGGNTLVLTK